jgi:hypothetical protein
MMFDDLLPSSELKFFPIPPTCLYQLGNCGTMLYVYTFWILSELTRMLGNPIYWIPVACFNMHTVSPDDHI